MGLGQQEEGPDIVLARGGDSPQFQQQVHLPWTDLQCGLEGPLGAIIMPGARCSPAEIRENVESPGSWASASLNAASALS